MGIPLTKLVTDIGKAVQNANAAIEQYAAEAYLTQGYVRTPENDGDEKKDCTYQPLTYTLEVPAVSGKKQLCVPATVLMNHTSLQLEQVDVKLKFELEEGEGEEVMVKVKSAGTPKDIYTVSELSLQFKTAPPAEGKARLENRHIQTL